MLDPSVKSRSLAGCVGQNNPEDLSKRKIRFKLFSFLIIVDMAMVILGFALVNIIYIGSILQEHLYRFVPIILIIYYAIGIRRQAYRPSVVISPSKSATSAAISMIISLLVIVFVTFAAKSSDDLSRVVSIVGSVISCLLLIFGRVAFSAFAYSALNGSPESEIVLVDDFRVPNGCTAFKIDAKAFKLKPDINDPVMLDRISGLIRNADRVIIACHPERRAEWAATVKGMGVSVEVLTPEIDAIGAIHTNKYYDVSTTLVAVGPLNAVDRAIKRCFDLFVATIAVVVLSPLLVLTAIAIKMDSKGSILFVQPRIGEGNRIFKMYKFRSMRSDKLDLNASTLTARDDPRVTRVGNFIRKTSIDELPQILNVIVGDMSVVGPRPHAMGATAGQSLYWEVSDHYWNRHAVKPGLTGLAQVRGFRGNTETKDDLINRLQSDLAYLESWSLFGDIKIIFQTFGVLLHKNAF